MCIESHAYPWYPFHDITWNPFCVSSHKSSQVPGSMLQKCKWYWHYHTALQSEAQLFHLPIIPYTGQWKHYASLYSLVFLGIPSGPLHHTSTHDTAPPPILPPQASSLMLACLPQLRPPELTAARTSHHKFYLLHAWYKLSPIYDIHFATVFKYLHF